MFINVLLEVLELLLLASRERLRAFMIIVRPSEPQRDRNRDLLA